MSTRAKPLTLKKVLNSVPVSFAIYAFVMWLIIYGAYAGAQAMGYNWQWYRMPQYFYTLTDDGFQLGEIMIGLGKTIQLSLTAFALATIFGLFIALLEFKKGLATGKATLVKRLL